MAKFNLLNSKSVFSKKRSFAIIIAFAVIFIFLVSGCNNRATSNQPDKYHVGTKGLEMSFIHGTPPSKIYEGDDLTVVVQLQNKGAFPSEDSGYHFEGKLHIGGFDTQYININPRVAQIDSSLYGKDQYNNEGTYDEVTFTANNVRLPKESDSYNPTVQVTSCYRYKTYASPVVCIDPDPYSSKIRKKVCNVHDVSLSGGQGAPVAVSRVEESVSKNTIKFKIYFRNLGNGYVIDPDYIYSDCPETDRDNADKVDVYVRLSGAQANCKPSNPIRMINNQGFVICDVPKPPESTPAYTTPLHVELTYGYSSTISKPISIIQD